jgi:hypothetical protein
MGIRITVTQRNVKRLNHLEGRVQGNRLPVSLYLLYGGVIIEDRFVLLCSLEVVVVGTKL